MNPTYLVLYVIVTIITVVLIDECITFRNCRGHFWYIQIDFFQLKFLPSFLLRREMEEGRLDEVSLNISMLNYSLCFFTYIVPAKKHSFWFWCDQTSETERECLISIGFGRRRAFCMDITTENSGGNNNG